MAAGIESWRKAAVRENSKTLNVPASAPLVDSVAVGAAAVSAVCVGAAGGASVAASDFAASLEQAAASTSARRPKATRVTAAF